MNAPKPYYIYGLCDESGVRYIGKTCDLTKRYSKHICDLSGKTHKMNWIRKLLSNGQQPRLHVYEYCDSAIVDEREKWWISFLRRCKVDLTNSTDGGDGQVKGYIPTAETRQKISIAHKGRKHTPEAKAKMSAKLKGQKRTPEQVANMKAAVTGVKRSADTRARISAAQKRRTPETLAKLSKATWITWQKRKGLWRDDSE